MPGRRGRRALWYGVAGVTAVVTVGVVGLPQVGWLAAQTVTTTWTAHHTIGAVEVDASGGDVIVRSGAAGGAASLRETLTWTVNKPRVTESWQGDTLLISEDCAAPAFTVVNPCGASLELSVPASVSVQATVDSGQVQIRGMSGGASARAESGDIELDDDSGAVWARADSGEITGQRLTSAQVNVQTMSGDVALAFAAAPQSVAASVTSGQVTITVPQGSTYRVSGQTTAGDRQIAPGLEDGASSRQISIDTDSGDADLSYAGGG